MPPICFHLGIAEEAIERLRHPIINSQKGSYFLGSTTPDIRFFISATREETHFLALDAEEGESGVRYLFEAYPELRNGTRLNDISKAFVLGYLSHLVTDEAWIYRIYRPFFGKTSPLAQNPVANLFDRLLQFELDRRERINSRSISLIRQEIVTTKFMEIDVGFLEASDLNRWQEFVFVTTTRKPNWEDFRIFAEKYLIWMRQVPDSSINDFFSSFDQRLEEVFQMVPEDEIQAFREQAIADSVRVAEEYLL